MKIDVKPYDRTRRGTGSTICTVLLWVGLLSLVLASAGCDMLNLPPGGADDQGADDQGAGGVQAVEAPVIDPAGGSFTGGPISVTLTCPTAGATIVYTTDGSDPRGSATCSDWTGTPLSITDSLTVRAYAHKDGMDDSTVVEAVFTYTSAVPPEPENPWEIVNGDFSYGMEEWQLNVGENAAATATVEDGALRLDIADGGSDPWEIQLFQFGIELEEGWDYRLTFVARSAPDAEIAVKLTENHVTDVDGDGNAYTPFWHQYVIRTGGEARSFEFYAPINTAGVGDSLLEFNFGGNTGAIWLDDITLQRVRLSDVVFVSGAGSDDNPGDDAAAPKRTIGNALTAVSDGGEIRVAGGYEYAESLDISRYDTAISGGWSPDFSTQDPKTYPTVIDASDSGSRVVSLVPQQHYSLSLELVGLTLTGGESDAGGGGIYAQHATVSLGECVLRGNRACGPGGGIYVTGGGWLLVERSVIDDNETDASGGGIAVDSGGTNEAIVRIDNSRIASNRAGMYGGGLHLSDLSSSISYLYDSFVADNTCDIEGGGMSITSTPAENIRLRSCTFAANVAPTASPHIYGSYDDSGENELFDVLPFSDLETAGSAIYVPGTFEYSAPLYVDDRSINAFVNSIPDAYRDLVFVRTAAADTDAAFTTEFLSFYVDEPSRVYLGYDADAATPSWLDSFSPAGETFYSMELDPDGTRDIYYLDVDPGTVTLGSNNDAGSGASFMYTVIVGPQPATPAGPIESVSAVSGSSYALVTMESNALIYTDVSSPDGVVQNPAAFDGLQLIQTAQSDVDWSPATDEFLSLTASTPVSVFVLYDYRGLRPTWLSDWADTYHDVGVNYPGMSTLHAYVKNFPAGTVWLGTNRDAHASGAEMYSVVVLECSADYLAESFDIDATDGDSENAVSVRWDPVDDALQYEIFKTSDSQADGRWSRLCSFDAEYPDYYHGAYVEYVDSGVEAGTDYTYKVIAIRGFTDGNVIVSNTDTGFVQPAGVDPPDAPAAAPVLVSGDGQIGVSWGPVDGADSYRVWYDTGADPSVALEWGSGTSSTVATIAGLTNGQSYTVWVTAVNTEGESGFSPAASATPEAAGMSDEDLLAAYSSAFASIATKYQAAVAGATDQNPDMYITEYEITVSGDVSGSCTITSTVTVDAVTFASTSSTVYNFDAYNDTGIILTTDPGNDLTLYLDGTSSGSFTGRVDISGDETGYVAYNLNISGGTYNGYYEVNGTHIDYTP